MQMLEWDSKVFLAARAGKPRVPGLKLAQVRVKSGLVSLVSLV